MSQKPDDVRWGAKGNKNPAFSYSPNKDMWHDHKSGNGGQLASLYHFYKDDMAGFVTEADHQKQYGAAKPKAELPKPESQPKYKILKQTFYDYTDQFGNKVYQVVRNLLDDQSKTIWQRHFEGASKRWVNGLSGVALYPYNLAKITTNKDQIIYVVEGEKCADKMTEMGFLATTNNGGAGNWKADLNRWFAGRDIVIIPDNDQTGTNHANKVTEQLKDVAKTIRRIILPVELPGEDIYDWFVIYGGTKDILVDMLNDLPNLDVEGNVMVPLDVLSWDELMNLPTPDFLISGYVVEGSFTLMYGPPANGKTFMALDMALSIATGKDWHGREVQQGAVIYIAAEGVGGLPKRGRAWATYYQKFKGLPFWTVPLPINFSSEKQVDQLKIGIAKILKQHGGVCRAIFVDTVAKSLLGYDENSSADTGSFISTCSQLQKQFQAAVIGIHHSGKDASRGMRGSSAFLGGVDTSLRVTKNDEDVVVLHVEKQKESEPANDAAFYMHKVMLISPDGEGESSIVLLPTNMPSKKTGGDKATKLSPKQFDALDTLNKHLTLFNIKDCHVIKWAGIHKDTGNAKLYSPDASKSAKQRSRARDDLITKGWVTVKDDKVTVTPRPDAEIKSGDDDDSDIPF